MNVDSYTQLKITNRLKEFGSVPIGTGILKSILKDYGRPNDKISFLAKEGYLVRLRKGVYVASQTLTGQKYNRFMIANNLYGPSYVSIHSALSHYGLIPEAVYTCTSVTGRRSKDYETPIGRYSYEHIPEDYYSIGHLMENDGEYNYMIASQEKALCDLIVLKRNFKIQSKKAMIEYLEQDMRIELELLTEFDLEVIDRCIDTNIKANELKLLRSVIHDSK